MRNVVLGALWGTTDPFAGIDTPAQERVEIQGWNSHHRFLADTIERTRPRLIVEIGVWKGASALFMASKLREHEIDGVVIAVDTWLGSAEHWTHGDIAFDRGYPRLFAEFRANVMACRLNDYVVPLPLDSGNAASLVRDRIGPVDMIHLDGAHDMEAVSFDLAKWWRVLASGGTFIGDDYYDDGHWPEVKRATDHFLSGVRHAGFGHEDGKWRATKL